MKVEEPKKEDYGYEPRGLENEGGWMLEGGEEAYYKALDKYKKQSVKQNDQNT